MTNKEPAAIPSLPCPFCGSDDIDPCGWLSNMGIEGPECSQCGAIASTVEAWNCRAFGPSCDESSLREALTTAHLYITQADADQSDYDRVLEVITAALAATPALQQSAEHPSSTAEVVSDEKRDAGTTMTYDEFFAEAKRLGCKLPDDLSSENMRDEQFIRAIDAAEAATPALPVPAIRQWHERTDRFDDESVIAALKVEIATLRAALAAKTATVPAILTDESLRDQVGRVISEHLADGIDICDSREIDIIADEVLRVVELAAVPGKGEAVDGVHWDLFPGYLIDHCEGDTISEEYLQHRLSDMLVSAEYKRIAAERVAPVAVDRNTVLDTVADLVWNWAGLDDMAQRRKCYDRILGMKSPGDKS